LSSRSQQQQQQQQLDAFQIIVSRITDAFNSPASDLTMETSLRWRCVQLSLCGYETRRRTDCNIIAQRRHVNPSSIGRLIIYLHNLWNFDFTHSYVLPYRIYIWQGTISAT